MKARVLMLNYEYPPLGGGSGNATRYLLREFAKAPGLRVDLVTSSSGRRLEKGTVGESVRIFRLPVNKLQAHYWTTRELARWMRRAFFFLRAQVRRETYDLCHCWSGWPPGVLGYLMRRRLPYLVALRGSDVPGYNARLARLDPLVFRRVSRAVWKHAAAVTVLSRNLESLARETQPSLTADIVYNGVDTDFLVPVPRVGDVFTILFVGRLIGRKGVLDLLRAFELVYARDSTVRLVIGGDGPERGRLEAFVHEHELEASVSFRGIVEHPDLPALYGEADVFVMPSLQEALGNAVLEAMAAGLPVITTPTGSAEPVGEAGTVVRPNDPEGIADAVLRYRTDPELLRSQGERARSLAEGMTWADTAKRTMEIYEKAIDAGS